MDDLIASVRLPDIGQVVADRTVGVDVIGVLSPPETPDFLRDPVTGQPYDYSGFGPDHGVHFLYLMNMLDLTPEPGLMDPATWDITEGMYSYQGEHHRVPLVVPSIWHGDPLSDTGPSAGFWSKFGSAANQFQGQALFVVFTDVPREVVEAVLGLTGWSEDPRLLAVQRMAAWAQDAGISLVNVGEVFSSAWPMGLQAEYLTEMAKQTGPGWAAASDNLRWEIADRFGGLYSDGDNVISSLEDFRSVADSEAGFAVHRAGDQVANSAVLMVPRHPAVGEIRELIRAQYGKTQQDMYGAAGMLRDFWVATEGGRAMRNSVLLRTFPPAVIDVLLRYGGVREVRDLPGLAGVSIGTDGSWKVPASEPLLVTGRAETLLFTQRFVHSLVRDLYNRNGDLRLTGAAGVAARHAQPQMVWEAGMRFLASRPDIRQLVRGVTLRRLVGIDDEFVAELPESVRGLLRYPEGEQPPLGVSEDEGDWFGQEHGGGWWLGEQSVAARLEPYEVPVFAGPSSAGSSGGLSGAGAPGVAHGLLAEGMPIGGPLSAEQQRSGDVRSVSSVQPAPSGRPVDGGLPLEELQHVRAAVVQQLKRWKVDGVPPRGVGDQDTGIRRPGAPTMPDRMSNSPDRDASWAAASAEIATGLGPERVALDPLHHVAGHDLKVNRAVDDATVAGLHDRLPDVWKRRETARARGERIALVMVSGGRLAEFPGIDVEPFAAGWPVGSSVRVEEPRQVGRGPGMVAVGEVRPAGGDIRVGTGSDAYTVGRAGWIELPSGDVLSAEGWVGHGHDFVHRPTGAFLRGDAGWIGLAADKDGLERRLDAMGPGSTQPYTLLSGESGLYLVPGGSLADAGPDTVVAYIPHSQAVSGATPADTPSSGQRSQRVGMLGGTPVAQQSDPMDTSADQTSAGPGAVGGLPGGSPDTGVEPFGARWPVGREVVVGGARFGRHPGERLDEVPVERLPEGVRAAVAGSVSKGKGKAVESEWFTYVRSTPYGLVTYQVSGAGEIRAESFGDDVLSAGWVRFGDDFYHPGGAFLRGESGWLGLVGNGTVWEQPGFPADGSADYRLVPYRDTESMYLVPVGQAAERGAEAVVIPLAGVVGVLPGLQPGAGEESGSVEESLAQALGRWLVEQESAPGGERSRGDGGVGAGVPLGVLPGAGGTVSWLEEADEGAPVPLGVLPGAGGTVRWLGEADEGAQREAVEELAAEGGREELYLVVALRPGENRLPVLRGKPVSPGRVVDQLERLFAEGVWDPVKMPLRWLAVGGGWVRGDYAKEVGWLLWERGLSAWGVYADPDVGGLEVLPSERRPGFGARLKEERERMAPLTLEKVADEAGVNASDVRRIEGGEVEPDTPTAGRLEEALEKLRRAGQSLKTPELGSVGKEEYAEWVRARQKWAGLLQNRLAEEADLHPANLGRLVAGKYKPLNDTHLRLVEVLAPEPGPAGTFRGWFKARRKQARLTQVQLAREAVVDLTYLRKIERGAEPDPGIRGLLVGALQKLERAGQSGARVRRVVPRRAQQAESGVTPELGPAEELEGGGQSGAQQAESGVTPGTRWIMPKARVSTAAELGPAEMFADGGKWVKTWRKRMQKDQTELASAANVDRSTLSKIELGKIEKPGPLYASKLVDAMKRLDPPGQGSPEENTYGTWVQDWRERLGLTQMQLVHKTGLLQPNLSKIEAGAYIPDLRDHFLLVQALHELEREGQSGAGAASAGPSLQLGPNARGVESAAPGDLGDPEDLEDLGDETGVDPRVSQQPGAGVAQEGAVVSSASPGLPSMVEWGVVPLSPFGQSGDVGGWELMDVGEGGAGSGAELTPLEFGAFSPWDPKATLEAVAEDLWNERILIDDESDAGGQEGGGADTAMTDARSSSGQVDAIVLTGQGGLLDGSPDTGVEPFGQAAERGAEAVVIPPAGVVGVLPGLQPGAGEESGSVEESVAQALGRWLVEQESAPGGGRSWGDGGVGAGVPLGVLPGAGGPVRWLGEAREGAQLAIVEVLAADGLGGGEFLVVVLRPGEDRRPVLDGRTVSPGQVVDQLYQSFLDGVWDPAVTPLRLLAVGGGGWVDRDYAKKVGWLLREHGLSAAVVYTDPDVERLAVLPSEEWPGFGAWLKARRLQAKLTKTRLGRKAVVDPTHIHRIETGKRKKTRPVTHGRLVKALHELEREGQPGARVRRVVRRPARQAKSGVTHEQGPPEENTYGKLLRASRKWVKLSQTELAHKVDVAQASISEIERDDFIPHPDVHGRLVETLRELGAGAASAGPPLPHLPGSPDTALGPNARGVESAGPAAPGDLGDLGSQQRGAGVAQDGAVVSSASPGLPSVVERRVVPLSPSGQTEGFGALSPWDPEAAWEAVAKDLWNERNHDDESDAGGQAGGVADTAMTDAIVLTGQGGLLGGFPGIDVEPFAAGWPVGSSVRVEEPRQVGRGPGMVAVGEVRPAGGDIRVGTGSDAYTVGRAGWIELPSGDVLSAEGWVGHGHDFVHRPTGAFLRGDTGWIGLAADKDGLERRLDAMGPGSTQPYTLLSGESGLYLVPGDSLAEAGAGTVAAYIPYREAASGTTAADTPSSGQRSQRVGMLGGTPAPPTTGSPTTAGQSGAVMGSL
ncbi:helix-turn-helix domain-containing protein, partial [Streptomyces mirabilis]|uniref:helix-turn-helix domain-containing protein n=1 Tax=Streptomyces mirabilis TaxID=68239 RepID=UPI00352EAF70